MYVHGTWHRLLMLMLIDADDAAADVDAGCDVDTGADAGTGADAWTRYHQRLMASVPVCVKGG